MPKQTMTDYRVLSAELDALLDELQSGELDIDKAIDKYKRGSEIIIELKKYLTTAENKIAKLK